MSYAVGEQIEMDAEDLKTGDTRFWLGKHIDGDVFAVLLRVVAVRGAKATTVVTAVGCPSRSGEELGRVLINSPCLLYPCRLRPPPIADIAALFVVADAATLVTDACHIGFLWNGYARSGLREVVVLYGHATFRCGFSGVVLSLPKRVAFEFQSTNVDPHHGLICIRRQFSVRHVKAEDIQVAVVELFVVLVVELAQRCGLVGLERGNGAIEHGFCFCRRAGLLCRSQSGATEQYQCSERSRKQVSTHGVLPMADRFKKERLFILRPLYPITPGK